MIQRWGDRLLTGLEAGVPYALDVQSLETLGEEYFGRMTLAIFDAFALEAGPVVTILPPLLPVAFQVRSFVVSEWLL